MNNEILTKLLKMVPENAGMELPPKVFIDMEGEFIEFVEGEKLVARFPNKERYMNPFGFMQGGIVVAAIDNTISPLGYIVAPPSITKEIITTYKIPIKKSDRFIDVIGTILEQSEKHIKLKAAVMNEKGKLVAVGIATCVFVKGKR